MRGRLGYVPALDGLRGIAIALVVSYHYLGVPFGGSSGVDLFFVLSGFLITTLLLEERAETGAVSLRSFYARRARRLLPALFTMLAAFTAISLVRGIDPTGDLARYGFYTANITRAFVDRASVTSSGLGHLWSLAEEEQFYLAWPLVLILIARSRWLLVTVAALVLALMAYRAALVLNGVSVLYRPDTRADGLLVGSTLAILRQQRRFSVSAGAQPWFVAFFAFWILIGTANIEWSVVGLSSFEIICAGLILAAVTSGSQLGTALSWSPLVFLGKISYSLYLWHFMIWWALGWAHPLAALGISLACAWASYRFVEQPFRRHRTTKTARPTPHDEDRTGLWIRRGTGGQTQSLEDQQHQLGRAAAPGELA